MYNIFYIVVFGGGFILLSAFVCGFVDFLYRVSPGFKSKMDAKYNEYHGGKNNH